MMAKILSMKCSTCISQCNKSKVFASFGKKDRPREELRSLSGITKENVGQEG